MLHGLRDIGYWQDVGCCLQTFMEEKLFSLRQGIHLHVFDAVIRFNHVLGLGSCCVMLSLVTSYCILPWSVISSPQTVVKSTV